MQLKISEGNIKLGKIPNVNVIPCKDCRSTVPCKSECYAMKAFRQYPNVRHVWSSNSKLFRNNLGQAFSDIRDYLIKKQPKRFRIHSAGDFINQAILDGWKQIAREFPETKFLAFTKQFRFDFKNVPSNLKIYLSIWPGDKCKPSKTLKDRYPTATMINKESQARGKACPGSCKECEWCYDSKGNISFIKH